SLLRDGDRRDGRRRPLGGLRRADRGRRPASPRPPLRAQEEVLTPGGPPGAFRVGRGDNRGRAPPRPFPGTMTRSVPPALLRAAVLLLAAAIAAASPAAGFASPDRRSETVAALLQRYRAVEGRIDDEGYETARVALDQLADLSTEESRRALRELA